MWKVRGRDVEGKGKGCGRYKKLGCRREGEGMWKGRGEGMCKVEERDVEGKGKGCGR